MKRKVKSFSQPGAGSPNSSTEIRKSQDGFPLQVFAKTDVAFPRATVLPQFDPYVASSILIDHPPLAESTLLLQLSIILRLTKKEARRITRPPKALKIDLPVLHSSIHRTPSFAVGPIYFSDRSRVDSIEIPGKAIPLTIFSGSPQTGLCWLAKNNVADVLPHAPVTASRSGPSVSLKPD